MFGDGHQTFHQDFHNLFTTPFASYVMLLMHCYCQLSVVRASLLNIYYVSFMAFLCQCCLRSKCQLLKGFIILAVLRFHVVLYNICLKSRCQFVKVSFYD